MPIELQLHVVAMLSTAPSEARRLVNRQVIAELGTGLIARDPELAIHGDQVAWRVPIWMSLPTLGDIGQVGAVDVDARTGAILISDAGKDKIIQHAQKLYAGATLSAK